MNSTVSNYLPSLVVYVVWHPACEEGKQLAERLYSHLARDVNEPVRRGLGIPVFFRSLGYRGPDALPRDIPLDQARHSAVVGLIDDELINAEGWDEYLADLYRQTAKPDSPHRVFPVSLSPYAFELHETVAKSNFVGLHKLLGEQRAQRLLSQLTHELCRLLLQQPRIDEAAIKPTPPVNLFISHAKLDAANPAARIRDYVRQNTGLSTFFDANDIPPGNDFAEVLKRQAGRSTLIAIQSDAYASREWCRREVLIAKRHGCPVVVINAVREREERSFPYLGNVASLRCDLDNPDGLSVIVDLALYETLRNLYLQQHFESLREALSIPKEARLLSGPVELLTLLQLSSESDLKTKSPTLIIYPDPPLGDAELQLLEETDPNLRLTTPTLYPWLRQ